MGGWSFARLVVVASALPFLGIGAAFLVAPEGMASRIDLALGSALARSDVRAVYGGLQLGIGTALVCAALSAAWLRAGLALLLMTYGSLAFGRLVGLLVDGSPSPFGIALLAAELVGVACGGIAWRASAS